MRAAKLKLRVVFYDNSCKPGNKGVWYEEMSTVFDAQQATLKPHAVRVEQRKRGEWHDIGSTGCLILKK